MAQAVNSSLAALYEDYYGAEGLDTKRAIAARDSVAHIRALHPEPLGRVIDVGAGNGSVLRELIAQNAVTEITAVEISASGIEKINAIADPRLKEVVQFDGYRLPFADQSFDVAISIHVMEHVEHERLLIAEMARVAREIIFEVPLEGGARGRAYYDTGHINYYTPLSFRALVETTGLEVVADAVLTSSRDYEQFLYGKAKGAVRNAMRRSVLSLLGRQAPHLMTFLYAVRCRTAGATQN